MTKMQLAFSKGDWIVHTTHGIGQITGMDTKDLLGEKRVFYVVHTEAVQYWLPVSETDSGRVRPLASTESFEEALVVMGKEPEKLDDNSRRRLLHIEALCGDGTLLSRAQIIRDMHARGYQKYVHVNEKRILDNLKEQFLEEWVVVSEIDANNAVKKMRAALERSCSDLKPKKPVF